ncbi:hypothetical protein H310_01236 [Aphanomyces invadans]|uniref:VWFA domain-containing protein n=1 Tax=Aphanomyces invadans TaxID=157072 RepID=A0A024UR99_9STRA|nr:hypothetical protein H310_01236 [Aphanomyces invadans]ETW08710.1 hypothetical protein H310_01236 [Aphanomyces invadans]|eukprot:XP_008862515.1 hypothetical protein H310_01236 [Aphanomyces invadans]
MRCRGLLTFVALSVVSAVSTASTYVPLVLWSNTGSLEHPVNDIAGKNANADYSVTQVSKTLSFLQDNDVDLQDSLNAHSPYEVFYPRAKALVLFVRDTLRLDEMEHFQGTALETIYRNASSAVSYPHTTRSSAADTLTATLAPHHSISLENIKEFFQQKQILGTSGKTDLVLVLVSNSLPWKEVAQMIRTSVALFDHATSNRVIYGFTGDHTTITPSQFGGFHRALQSAAAVVAPLVCPPGSFLSTALDKPFCFTHYVYMTPMILAALVLGFFFLFCVFVGLSALNGIQTPLKYPSIAPPKGKEY